MQIFWKRKPLSEIWNALLMKPEAHKRIVTTAYNIGCSTQTCNKADGIEGAKESYLRA